jgi:hypothetical protein
MNNECNKTHLMWDPCFTYHRGRLWVMCLTAKRNSTKWGTESFWKKPNGAAVFSLDNGKFELLTRLEPAPGRRLCAGSLGTEEGKLIAYLSDTTIEGDVLDQRCYKSHVIAKDTYDVLKPSEHDAFKSRVTKPGTNDFVHACRDPYLGRHTWSEQIHISTGGFRWGVPPQVVHARRDGKKWDCQVALFDTQYDGHESLTEIERVSVVRDYGLYYMFCHCMASCVSEDMKRVCANLGEVVTDSTIWRFESLFPEGPFVFCDIPCVIGSGATGMYGTHIIDDGRDPDNFRGMGWDMKSVSCDRRQFFTMERLSHAITMDRHAFDIYDSRS